MLNVDAMVLNGRYLTLAEVGNKAGHIAKLPQDVRKFGDVTEIAASSA